jgi:hypothetical protein
MLIELVEGFYVDPFNVAVVKATDENTCALFTPGQSAIDGGFTVPYSAADVVEQLNDAVEEEERDPAEEDEDEEAAVARIAKHIGEDEEAEESDE